jgi:hypothetical protein
MIVFSNAYAAAEAAASRPLTRARIGYQTWTRDLAASAVTVSSESDEGPGDMPNYPDTYTFWEPTSLPATRVVDFGTGRDVDYGGLVHTLGSSQCSVLLETSDGSLAGSPEAQVWTALGTEIAPGNDAPLMFLDTSRVGRYGRISVARAGSSTTMPRINVAHFGQVLAMPRGIQGGHSPMNLARDTELDRALSRGGQFLGQGFVRHGMTGSAAWRYLDPTWYRQYFDPFVQSARRYPFFFAWRPQTWPLEVGYAWALGNIRPTNMGVREFMEVGFNMHGIGHEQ